MEGLDEDGGCRMKCFRVMRQMKEDVWCAGNKPVITAYHLQVGITMISRYGPSICYRGMTFIIRKSERPDWKNSTIFPASGNSTLTTACRSCRSGGGADGR